MFWNVLFLAHLCSLDPSELLYRMDGNPSSVNIGWAGISLAGLCPSTKFTRSRHWRIVWSDGFLSPSLKDTRRLHLHIWNVLLSSFSLKDTGRMFQICKWSFQGPSNLDFQGPSLKDTRSRLGFQGPSLKDTRRLHLHIWNVLLSSFSYPLCIAERTSRVLQVPWRTQEGIGRT